MDKHLTIKHSSQSQRRKCWS